MKVRLSIMTENKKPVPNADLEKLEEKVRAFWQMVIDGFLLFDTEDESATVESVEIIKDGDGDGE